MIRTRSNAGHKRPRTTDGREAIARAPRGSPAKKACSTPRQYAYETPTPDIDVFDMLPVEMVRNIMMHISKWRDVVALQATARRFANVLAPCDTWVRKYALHTPFDITAPPRGSCPEPIEAFVAVHARWGMNTKGFDEGGLMRLAEAGRTEVLMWLDRLHIASERAKAQARHVHAPAWAKVDNSDHTVQLHEYQAHMAIKGGHAETLAAILANDPAVIGSAGSTLMQMAVASNSPHIVDVVHNFTGATGARHRWCGSAPRARLPATDSLEPMAVFDHLVAVGCPTATDIHGGTLGPMLANGVMGLVVWLHKQTRVPQRRCTRRNMDEAASRGHFAAVRWAHEQGMRRCALSTLVAAVRSCAHRGTLDFVRWALGQEDATHRRPPRVPEWRDGLLAIEAARAGAVDVVRWLYENHPETVTMQAARAATTACNAEVAIYLHEVGVAPFDAYRPLRRVTAQLCNDEANRPMGHPTTRQIIAALGALAAAGAPYDTKALEQAAMSHCGPALALFAKHYCRPDCALGDEPMAASGGCDDARPRKAACALPTPDDIMAAAVRSNHLDTIRWVKKNIPDTRLCLAIEMMRAGKERQTRINALGKCSCPACKLGRS
nr:hypothetical protein [Pandoravirus massiliensis]